MTSHHTVEQSTLKQPASEKLTLDQLPADVLVRVMQFLYEDELIYDVRLVCKRLCALVLHPDVWRNRKIGLLGDCDPCICTVLYLAPCLERVLYTTESHTEGFIDTMCAARELRISAGLTGERVNLEEVGLVLANQESLGRLRRVSLIFLETCEVDDDELFLKTLASCSDLESLDINLLPLAMKPDPSLCGPSRPSLRYFKCEVSRASRFLVNIVLTSHAATLEEVDLSPITYNLDRYGFESEGARARLSDVLAGPLARMPKLRRLSCEVFAEMEAFAGPNVLTEVTFFLYDYKHSDGRSTKGAAHLLRRAHHLRSITLQFQLRHRHHDDIRILIQSLASSERPLVERLSVSCLPESAVQFLLPVLPRLPALQKLTLFGYGVDNPSLLLSVTADTNPALRSVDLESLGRSDDGECGHAWLHREDVRAALAANPSLHVQIRRSCRGDCEVCARDCHPQIERLQYLMITLHLFSHDPDCCPYPEDHDHVDGLSSEKWIHIPCDA